MFGIPKNDFNLDCLLNTKYLKTDLKLKNQEFYLKRLKMIIDSHCHLDYQPLFNNLEHVIKRANNNGVKYFLTISTTDESFKNILNIIKNYKNIFGSYGIHPHEAKNYEDLKVQKIIQNLSLNENLIGVGETGLDFYYNHSDKQYSKRMFH